MRERNIELSQAKELLCGGKSMIIAKPELTGKHYEINLLILKESKKDNS